MTSLGSGLSTAEIRRSQGMVAELSESALGGFYGTTVALVARRTKISSAYVFKLFRSKESLFAAAVEQCFDEILSVFERGDAEQGRSSTVLDAMGGAYVKLFRGPRLLMLHLHAQSVLEIPEISAVLRAGLCRITIFAKEHSGASDEEVQRFIAYRQLCHLLVMTAVDDVPEEWARILDRGMRRPE